MWASANYFRIMILVSFTHYFSSLIKCLAVVKRYNILVTVCLLYVYYLFNVAYNKASLIFKNNDL